LGRGYDEDRKTFAGMGADFVDYDNDGSPDVFGWNQRKASPRQAAATLGCELVLTNL
jgi:hypothetical protein